MYNLYELFASGKTHDFSRGMIASDIPLTSKIKYINLIKFHLVPVVGLLKEILKCSVEGKTLKFRVGIQPRI